MTLLHYGPWNTMERLHRQIDQIVGDTFSAPQASNQGGVANERAAAWIPSVDIHEEPGQFIVQADLPGVQPKDISVTADNGVLTLSGQRRAEQREQQKGCSRLERVEGTFLRRFTLPEDVKTDDIRAHYSNGVLEVSIPKTPASEPRRVNIETH